MAAHFAFSIFASLIACAVLTHGLACAEWCGLADDDVGQCAEPLSWYISECGCRSEQQP